MGVSFAVVVVTYKNGPALGALLDGLARERRPGDEVLIVDNDSADGTADFAEAHAAVDRVVRSRANLGFAAGANLGAAETSADTLLFLNPDCELEPGFLDAMRRPPADWSAWMGLVALADGQRVNTSEGRAHFLGIAWAGNYGRPVSSVARHPYEASFLSGACLAIRRCAWDDVGGFPESFFMYLEDVDLSHRLRLRGHAFGVIPAARVRHDYEFQKGSDKWRLLERNRWLCVVRTYPSRLLAVVLPALLVAEPALIVYSMLGGWGRAKLRASREVLSRLPVAIAERRTIQRSATSSSAAFAEGLCADLDSPFLGAVGRSRLVRSASRAYWHLACRLLGSARSEVADTDRPAPSS